MYVVWRFKWTWSEWSAWVMDGSTVQNYITLQVLCTLFRLCWSISPSSLSATIALLTPYVWFIQLFTGLRRTNSFLSDYSVPGCDHEMRKNRQHTTFNFQTLFFPLFVVFFSARSSISQSSAVMLHLCMESTLPIIELIYSIAFFCHIFHGLG